jgi:hypothetical protein
MIVRFMLAGVMFVVPAGIMLRWTGWFPTRPMAR